MIKQTLFAAAAGLLLLGMGGKPAEEAAPEAPAIPDYIAAAVADPGRPAEDVERDVHRKPAEMLVFAEVQPGEAILEILPGGGYFTRIFSKAIGPEGTLIAAVGAPPPETVDQAIRDYAAGRLKAAQDMAAAYGNITVSEAMFSALTAEEPVDLVWTSQNYHDLHAFGADVAAVNASVLNVLKPGGLYIVLDHSAVPGSPMSVTGELHRIDEATVKAEVEAAGFEYVGSSDALRNPDDPRTGHVINDETIRGKTDQFILKFRKPE